MDLTQEAMQRSRRTVAWPETLAALVSEEKLCDFSTKNMKKTGNRVKREVFTAKWTIVNVLWFGSCWNRRSTSERATFEFFF